MVNYSRVIFTLLVSVFSIFLLGNNTSFANSIEGNNSNYINSDETSYDIVSEEKVILDFMEKENTDRETAKKELNIGDTNNQLSACTTQWRYYTSRKMNIESGANITLSPYVQVKSCSGTDTFINVSSAQPGYAFSGIFSGFAHFTSAGATLTSSKRIDVHASGYMKHFTTNYWNVSECISSNEVPGKRCF